MGTDKRARQKESRGTRLEQAQRAAASQQRKRRLVNLTMLAVAAVAVVIVFLVIGGNDDDKPAASSSQPTTTVAGGPTACPNADGSSPKQVHFTEPPPMCIDPAKSYTAKFDTSKGTFSVKLDPARAPKTVNNFVVLSRYHFYDGVTFHRIIADFVIQGGDPTGTGTGGPGYKFDDELPQPSDYKAGSLVMANSGPNTNGSQFFVVLSENGAKTLVAAVNGAANYSLFGQVTEGMDVVSAIGAVETDQSGDPNKKDHPKDPVTITTVTITES